MHVEPKIMQVLVLLADNAGSVLTKEEILEQVWSGAYVSPEVLTNAVWRLRQAFGDDARDPRFIQTVPRIGYRLVASVRPSERPRRRLPHRWFLNHRGAWASVTLSATLLATALTVSAAIGIRVDDGGSAWPCQTCAEWHSSEVRSLALLPWRSLTPCRGAREFADSLTELTLNRVATDRLVRVAPRSTTAGLSDPEASEKTLRKLNADAFLHGSVFVQEKRIRVTVQLVDPRIDHVLWTESFDGTSDQGIELQDRITEAIAEALNRQGRQGI